jgi:hypothetical protein
MICSDFHPVHKIIDVNGLGNPSGDYFSNDITECEVAHARFYDDEKRKTFPKCKVRRYTLSEIFNAVISNGFIIKGFEEYPGWFNKKLPGEFTILAEKGL